MQSPGTGGLQSDAWPPCIRMCHGGSKDGCRGYGCDGLCGAATISCVVGEVSMAVSRVLGGIHCRAFAGGVGIVGVGGGDGSVSGMLVGMRLDLPDLFLFFLGGSAEFHHCYLFVFLRDDVEGGGSRCFLIVTAVALIAVIVVVVVIVFTVIDLKCDGICQSLVVDFVDPGCSRMSQYVTSVVRLEPQDMNASKLVDCDVKTPIRLTKE